MWKWYKIFNLSTLDALNVPDYYLSVNLRGLGKQEIVIAKGFNVSVLFLGYWITPMLNNRNGFSVEDKVSAYIDEENNLWVGYNENRM